MRKTEANELFVLKSQWNFFVLGIFNHCQELRRSKLFLSLFALKFTEIVRYGGSYRVLHPVISDNAVNSPQPSP